MIFSKFKLKTILTVHQILKTKRDKYDVEWS